MQFGPATPIYSVGGAMPTRQRQSARLPVQARTITSHAPDYSLDVAGLAVPYGIPVGDGIGGREMFTLATRWELSSEHVMLKANHTTPLGVCSVEEAPSGLHVVAGRVASAMRHYAADKKAFSIGFTSLDNRVLADGTVEHLAAILFEVSLVTRAAHSPYTAAAVSRVRR